MYFSIVLFLKVILSILLFNNSYALECDEELVKNYRDYHQDEENNEGALFLIDSKFDRGKELNNIFSNLAHQLGYHVFAVPEFCSDDELSSTLKATTHFTKVINLYVTNINNCNNLNNALSYAGIAQKGNSKLNTTTTIERNTKEKDLVIIPTTRKITENYTTDLDEIENCAGHCPWIAKEETIDHISQYTRTFVDELETNAVKLVSKSVEDDPSLFDIIKNLTTNYDPQTHKYWEMYIEKLDTDHKKRQIKFGILICLYDDVKDVDEVIAFIEELIKKYEYKRIFFKIDKHCDVENYYQHNLLAAVAPKPLDLEYKTLIPVLFYNTPYLLPEHKDKFPNSKTLYESHFKALSLALMKFFEYIKWNKIGVISDDSPYSEEFEENLTNLFDKQGVLYDVKQCMKRKCDFTAALDSLKEHDARIIVANVDAEYARQLSEVAHQKGMTLDNNVVWIWREWPFNSAESAGKMGDVFSIYLAPDKTFVKEKIHHHGARLNNILECLSMLQKVDNKLKKQTRRFKDKDEINMPDLYRKVLNALQEVERDTRRAIEAQLVKIHSNNTVEPISSYEVEGDTAYSSGYNRNFNFHGLPDDMEECTFTSYKFHHSCDDIYLLIIMLVIFAFMVAALVITTFFYRLKHTNNNYTTLYRQELLREEFRIVG